MGFGLKRRDLQAIAQVKLDDAKLLFKAGRYSNAYYLAGYAVEIALKACIARQVMPETIPDKYFLNKILTHDFHTLVGLAGLQAEIKAQKVDVNFSANWALVNEWNPDSRYETHDKTKAQFMIQAVDNSTSGVFQWIKAHW